MIDKQNAIAPMVFCFFMLYSDRLANLDKKNAYT